MNPGYIVFLADVAVHMDGRVSGRIPCKAERGWVGVRKYKSNGEWKGGCKRAKAGTAARVRGVQRVRQGKARTPAKAVKVTSGKQAKKGGEVILPKLKGTEKQVKWANDIRSDFVSLESKSPEQPQYTYIGPLPRLLRLEAKNPDSRNAINERKVYDAVLKINEAKWWIENRSSLDAYNFRSRYKMMADDLGIQLIERKRRSK